MARARPSDQELLLTAVVSRVHGTPCPVVVFDLDSTLLDNRPRQARILREYGEAAGLPALRDARPEHWQGWDLAVALRNAGLRPFQLDAHLAPARAFWRERFFTSRYCRLDVPIPGAPAFVAGLARAGARVAYVTGRHEGMREGTVDCLARHGFPIPGERVELLMKPDPELGDDDWKDEACREVERMGEVVAAFDNEPAHVNLYARAFPDALAIHLDTDHSGRPVKVLATVPSIRDFTLAEGAPAELAAP
jgi:phosphoglycolate phosphatase-like HAD superfamily hydrolase